MIGKVIYVYYDCTVMHENTCYSTFEPYDSGMQPCAVSKACLKQAKVH